LAELVASHILDMEEAEPAVAMLMQAMAFVG
jgi:hypothetical protein